MDSDNSREKVFKLIHPPNPAAKVPHEGHVYKGAQHGFHNDTTPRYDETAAKEAWQRTLDWFNKYLKASA